MVRISWHNHNYYVNGQALNYEADEIVGWSVRDTKDYTDEVIGFYSECCSRFPTKQWEKDRNEKNKEAMLKDIKKLLVLRCKYILVSMSSNRFLTPKHKSFEKTALRLLAVSKKLDAKQNCD